MALALLITSYQYSEWLALHSAVIGIFTVLLILVILFMIVFPGILVFIFFVEGVRVLKHEGAKAGNSLSMFFSALLCIYLVVWPIIGKLRKDTLGTFVYIVIGFCAMYMLSLMAVYVCSAILNLIHLRKNRKADCIIVLGAGIMGKEVTPLLAARIEKGIEQLRYNPEAMLIMSGGQGKGEDIPESVAMAAYAVEKGVDERKIILEQKSKTTKQNLSFSMELIKNKDSKIIIVTTAYHVFRALLLAKKQGIKCIGIGSKTKWYFTLNAMIREFIGYLSLTWKKHICIMCVLACIMVVVMILG